MGVPTSVAKFTNALLVVDAYVSYPHFQIFLVLSRPPGQYQVQLAYSCLLVFGFSRDYESVIFFLVVTLDFYVDLVCLHDVSDSFSLLTNDVLDRVGGNYQDGWVSVFSRVGLGLVFWF